MRGDVLRVVVFSRFPKNPDRPRGGIETVTVVLTRALSRIDELDVHVVTLERDVTTPTAEHIGNLTVHRLPGSPWPQIADILFGPGRKRLVRYLMDLKPDVVHTHETYGLVLGDFPTPHVFTIHGFDHANLFADRSRFAWLRSPLWRWVERYGLSHHRHVISITPYVRQMIEPLTNATIYDIENPVDERFFGATRREDPGRILCVGWINERKNTLASVTALAEVVRRGYNAVLTVAGQASDDNYYQRVVSCVEQNGLADRVDFVGHVDQSHLIEHLARASLFILPSRQENSPMAIAEAMAVGVPVISSNRCGMPYMIQEGQTGYLIEPEDHVALAERMIRLLDDSSLRQQMGEAARRDAERRFHPDSVARRTVEVYQKLINENTR